MPFWNFAILKQICQKISEIGIEGKWGLSSVFSEIHWTLGYLDCGFCFFFLMQGMVSLFGNTGDLQWQLKIQLKKVSRKST